MANYNFRKHFSLGGITIIAFLLSIPLGLIVVFPLTVELLVRFSTDISGVGFLFMLLLIPIAIITTFAFTLLVRRIYQGSKNAQNTFWIAITIITIAYIFLFITRQ